MKQHTINTLAAICFIAGMCLAGSDGVWWPWINIAGIGVFAMVPMLVRMEGSHNGNNRI